MVRYYLRDRNIKIVEAWRRAFEGIDGVEVSHGDIFDLGAHAVVSPANSFGFMDGGIDLTYSLRFGWEVQGRLQRLLHREYDGELPVGQAVLLDTGDRLIRWLVCAPTMRVPENVSKTVNAYLAFRAAIRAVRRHNDAAVDPIESVLCPGLGTLTGRLSPDHCARQMLAAYTICQLGHHPHHDSLHAAAQSHHALLS